MVFREQGREAPQFESFTDALRERGCEYIPITEQPEDLIGPERRPSSVEFQARINVQDIVSVLLMKISNGNMRAEWYFGGTNSTAYTNTPADVESRVMQSIDANIASKKRQEKGVEQLDQLVERLGGRKTAITEFPGDLEDVDDRKRYVSPEEYAKRGRHVFRIDFPGDTVLLVAPPTRDMYLADIYKNGKFYAGNHDFSIGEIEGNISRS